MGDTLKQEEARKGLIEKVKTKKRLAGSEGKDVDTWKRIQGGRNSRCEHSEVGPCLVSSKDDNSKEAPVAGGR